MKPRKRPLTAIMILHYIKLSYRSVLFIAAAVFYILNRVMHLDYSLDEMMEWPILPKLIWVVFVVEMIFRFFPSNLESMGCQKQFTKNYIPAGGDKPLLLPRMRVVAVFGAWILLNGFIGALYYLNVIDKAILLLVCLAYSVCDMVCILFFCPFQTWFLKNKCCGSCRIYNWDYAMMFTPLLFIKGAYSWSLLAFAFALLLRWEITAWRHPERFSEATNEALACVHCQEKLCHHKTQLHRFWQKNKHILKQIANHRGA